MILQQANRLAARWLRTIAVGMLISVILACDDSTAPEPQHGITYKLVRVGVAAIPGPLPALGRFEPADTMIYGEIALFPDSTFTTEHIRRVTVARMTDTTRASGRYRVSAETIWLNFSNGGVVEGSFRDPLLVLSLHALYVYERR